MKIDDKVLNAVAITIVPHTKKFPASLEPHIVRARKIAKIAITAYLKETQGWKPISEAPKDWSDMFLFLKKEDENDDDVMVTGYYSCADGGDDCWKQSGVKKQIYPTHFMPLPTPPKE